VPVGELPATVAVNVTGCPKLLGFCDDDSKVVVPAWLTVSVKACSAEGTTPLLAKIVIG